MDFLWVIYFQMSGLSLHNALMGINIHGPNRIFDCRIYRGMTSIDFGFIKTPFMSPYWYFRRVTLEDFDHDDDDWREVTATDVS